MRERDLAVAWIVLGVVFLLVLGWELNYWRSLSRSFAQASVEKARLTAQIREKEQETVSEIRKNSALLQEMSWTAAGADPATFMRRVAELAQGTRLRITSIGPLERQSTPQFNKSWHTIQITGPFGEFKELVGRVEAERGILEGVVLTEASRAAGVPPREFTLEEARRTGDLTPPADIAAQFRMTSLELTPQAKRVLEEASAATGIPLAAGAPPPLGLPVPTRPAGAVRERDPFVYGVQPAAPRPAVTARPLEAMELQGLVSFPGGFFAIVENQIVRVGDKVKGHRVEDITERGVLLRQPDGAPRRLVLPDIAVRAPGQPQAPPAGAPPAGQPAPAPTGPAAPRGPGR